MGGPWRESYDTGDTPVASGSFDTMGPKKICMIAAELLCMWDVAAERA